MGVELNGAVPTMSEFEVDNWVWSSEHKSSEVVLSLDRTAAYFHVDPMLESLGTAGVLGNKGFIDGEHYWEVTLLEPAYGTSVMIGVGTRKAQLHTSNYNYVNLIGQDNHSWGLSYKGFFWHGGSCRQYCQPFYEASTVIGIHLNLYDGTLTFYKNGKSLGVACQGLNEIGTELYPMISSTATGSEMQVGQCRSRYLSLQEKCYQTVARNLKRKADVDCLPLPQCFKRHLQCLKCH